MSRAAVAVSAAFVTLALFGAGVTAAASPIPNTLGAGLDPAPLNVDAASALRVTSYSALAETVRLTVSGNGYTVSPAVLTLAPGAAAVVSLTAVGPGPGILTAAVSPADPIAIAGAARAGMTLTTQLEHRGAPVNYLPPFLLALLAFCALGLVALRGRIVWRTPPRAPCELHGIVHGPMDPCRG